MSICRRRIHRTVNDKIEYQKRKISSLTLNRFVRKCKFWSIEQYKLRLNTIGVTCTLGNACLKLILTYTKIKIWRTFSERPVPSPDPENVFRPSDRGVGPFKDLCLKNVSRVPVIDQTNVLVGQLRAFRNITFWTAPGAHPRVVYDSPGNDVARSVCKTIPLSARASWRRRKVAPGKFDRRTVRENAAVRPLFSPRNRLLKLARYVRWPNALIKTAAQSQDRRESFSRGPGTPVSHLFNVGGRSGGVRTKALLVTLDSR